MWGNPLSLFGAATSLHNGHFVALPSLEHCFVSEIIIVAPLAAIIVTKYSALTLQ